jgi:5-methylcytosine-specific restriction protein A
MPRVPKQTLCRELGCGNPKVDRSFYCVDHGGAKALKYAALPTEERKAFNAMYQTKQWRQFRQIHLSKNPLCARCQSLGIVAPAHHVDHVFPHKMDRNKWMNNRFQSLCHKCHSIKTGLEKRGVIHDYVIGKIYDSQAKT